MSFFEPVLVRNRLGQGMALQVSPFSISADHVCVLVKVTEGAHYSLLSKNAENIVFQLRERFSRKVKNFSMIEVRTNADSDDKDEEWYGWTFNWVGNSPFEAKSFRLTPQKIDYYQGYISGLKKASGDN